MLHLTSQERKVIIFILCLVFFGMGLDFLKKKAFTRNQVDFEKIQNRLFEKVDINKAKFSEIITIPGVGEKLALAIIYYRNSHGKFRDIQELKKIKGIKDKKLEQLREYITLSKKKN